MRIPQKEDLERFANKVPDYIVSDDNLPSQPLEYPGEGLDQTFLNEDLTSMDACEVIHRKQTLRVDRAHLLPGLTGFHSSYDTVVRYNVKLIAERVEYRVETLEHIFSGKRVRADMSAIGPDRLKVTWDSIALIVCLAIQMALPIDRLRKLFASVSALSEASICRYLELSAQKLLPIYLHFVQQFVESIDVIAGDDTVTRVLGMQKGAGAKDKNRDTLLTHIEEKLGRAFPRKDGLGAKSQINVSHIHGRTDGHEPRSTIFFFRTHLGSVGDLLSKILTLKKPHHRPIVFQGDLSRTNLPEKSLIERWITYLAGCAAHARRDFYRFREDDDRLCDRMLELFAIVHAVERYLQQAGRKPELILYERRRLALPVWRQIIALAYSVLDAESKRQAKNSRHFLWPKGSKLYKACHYIVRHQEELTRYIFDHRLSVTNNAAERQLRGEKILLVACKFRKSEKGRVVFDILRTIVMTAAAACDNPKAYLTWVLQQPDDDIKKCPQDFTPLAYYQKVQRDRAYSDLQPTGT